MPIYLKSFLVFLSLCLFNSSTVSQPFTGYEAVDNLKGINTFFVRGAAGNFDISEIQNKETVSNSSGTIRSFLDLNEKIKKKILSKLSEAGINREEVSKYISVEFDYESIASLMIYYTALNDFDHQISKKGQIIGSLNLIITDLRKRCKNCPQNKFERNSYIYEFRGFSS